MMNTTDENARVTGGRKSKVVTLQRLENSATVFHNFLPVTIAELNPVSSMVSY